jgi:hypothetical protein
MTRPTQSLLSNMLRLFVLFLFISQTTLAQPKSRFYKDHLFFGSGLNLGFFNGFIIGLNPELGYSLTSFMDAGVAINFNYVTQNSSNSAATFRQTVFGGGPFLRIWPTDRFFIGSQYEYNTIALSERLNGSVLARRSYGAPSLLVGGGFGSRFIGQSQFYTTIMIDVAGDRLSPYVDQFGRQLPVFRTGFSFYFGQSGRRR